MKPLIAITGNSGQLGKSLQQISSNYPNFRFLFLNRQEIDLGDLASIDRFFQDHKPNIFINCAAYTAVDKAENEQTQALTANAMAVSKIAQYCAKVNATLITISTDYVFDGNGTTPYTIHEPTNPINYYGYSKCLGEKLAMQNNANTIVIRTSWVFAPHGSNFVKTMLRLLKEKAFIKVVSDQVGCPTYAPDLAEAIMHIVEQLPTNSKRGIYHFSNTGIISWFEFASTIQQLTKIHCTVEPIPTSAYPTPAKRPSYSAMDLHDIQNDFGVQLTDWQTSLTKCLTALQEL